MRRDPMGEQKKLEDSILNRIQRQHLRPLTNIHHDHHSRNRRNKDRIGAYVNEDAMHQAMLSAPANPFCTTTATATVMTGSIGECRNYDIKERARRGKGDWRPSRFTTPLKALALAN